MNIYDLEGNELSVGDKIWVTDHNDSYIYKVEITKFGKNRVYFNGRFKPVNSTGVIQAIKSMRQ